VLGWSGLCVSCARADEKVLESRAASAGAKTNVAGSTVKPPAGGKSGLLRLEEELSRSFDALKPAPSSLDGVAPPPLEARPVPTRQSKRAKELQDRRKSWIFMTPEELMGTPKSDDFFKLPEDSLDSQDRKTLSPVERFYQRLERRKSGETEPKERAAQDRFNPRDEQATSNDADSPDDPSLPSDLRGSEKALRKLLGSEKSGAAASPSQNSIWDIFGFGEKVTSPKDELAHKEYMKRYQEEVLGVQPTGASGDALTAPFGGPLAQPVAPVSPGTLPGGLSTSIRPDGFDPLLGAVSPTYIPNASSDPTARALNQWNPLYATPKAEPPKWNPPAPNFDVPRRKF
jgi:hypothetical protein